VTGTFTERVRGRVCLDEDDDDDDDQRDDDQRDD